MLEVSGPPGRQVDAVEAGQENDFRLHVDGGGKLTPGKDPRILNFRVFQIDAN